LSSSERRHLLEGPLLTQTAAGSGLEDGDVVGVHVERIAAVQIHQLVVKEAGTGVAGIAEGPLLLRCAAVRVLLRLGAFGGGSADDLEHLPAVLGDEPERRPRCATNHAPLLIRAATV